LYGIEKSAIIDEIDLIIDYPSKIAAMLLHNEIDIGLVPVAVIPEMKEYYYCTDYCIGCKGEVASVCLFSDWPIDRVKRILLDYQSKTSVQLAKILLKKYWKLSPELIDAKEDFRAQIREDTAALVIGDRALEQRLATVHIYDLGYAWKELTGLPFVFAAWVSNKKLNDDFIKRFNAANKFGLENINALLNTLRYTVYDLRQYYTKRINYHFDEEKRKGLDLFLAYLAQSTNKAVQ
jgi:chorismate dehydratase